jgi:gamma-glutamylcyclotransferase (GGCT)/AIG2-like uncharacterized protein YtfP
VQPLSEYLDPPRLFAYGTLQPDRLRWPFLAPFAVGHRAAKVPGRIYDSGYGWPVAVFDGSHDLVPGTIIDLDPVRSADAIELLDEVEATATDLLRRIVVTTTAGEQAWAYHCDHPTSAMTRIVAWNRPDER